MNEETKKLLVAYKIGKITLEEAALMLKYQRKTVAREYGDFIVNLMTRLNKAEHPDWLLGQCERLAKITWDRIGDTPSKYLEGDKNE